MSLFPQFQSLTLNGKKYHSGEIKALSEEKLNRLPEEHWETKLFGFLGEWFNDSPTIIARTSGTTGKPKAIKIEKDKMLQSAMMTIRYLQLLPNDAALLCLSCGHIAGKMMVVRAFAGGLSLVSCEPCSNPLMQIPESQKIDFAAFVPLQVKEILSSFKTSNQFKQIKNVLIGGAPISPELKNWLHRMPNAIYETYGMTETISHVALKKLSKESNEDYFTLLNGITVESNEQDCLVIHAPYLSPEPIITSDIAELKDNRHFKWLGRADNVVNSGGVKLIPEVLEEKIRHLTSRRFFFAGKQDEKLGERLLLVIEGDVYSEDELIELRKELSKALDKYELPKEILFVSRFRETPEGKILKHFNQ